MYIDRYNCSFILFQDKDENQLKAELDGIIEKIKV